MRHRQIGSKLGWKTAHRNAALRSLSTSLFEHERITTTLPRAKTLRPYAEKLITMSKREDLHARRLVARQIRDPKIVKKLFDTLSARYVDRHGGYMRILKLGHRQGDNAEMAIVELLGSEPDFNKAPEKKTTMGGRLAERLRGKKKDAAPEGDAASEGPDAPEAGAAKKARAPRTKK
ncbi:MAG: 50S ribosomal protein L17 [Acidobacteria bacterium]|nr:50S ribosomal protein L17 [Acidobacteriota bacterium]